MFLPENTEVPAGYESLDFKRGSIVVCQVKGKEPDVYFFCCMDALKENGLSWKEDESGVKWCYERYVPERFLNKDEEGNIVLDQCFFL